jgi:site-specific recombinase XerD
MNTQKPLKSEKSTEIPNPVPLLDSIEHVHDLYKKCQQGNAQQIILDWLTHLDIQNIQDTHYAVSDFQAVLNFIYSYRGSQDTFNAYRRELERLLQWSWLVQKKSILSLKRADIEDFIEFCQAPYKSWIGIKIVARFQNKDIERMPNPEWRPFIAKISKKAHQDGQQVEKIDFLLSQQGIKILFAVLSSFYNFSIQEEVTEHNPLLQIRQKSKFIRKTQASRHIRRLSDTQWNAVLKTAEMMAIANPTHHERTLFIMNILYCLYLRISELSSTKRWSPKMADFFRDSHNNWWFRTVGKGNKERQIAVSDAMLSALKRWRQHLELTILPTVDDHSPLLPKYNSKEPMSSTRAIRNIVQACFDLSVEALKKANLLEEADMLRSATVHWLRHTGISDDVKRRPREHVRDDAGHGSGATTDHYIDVELLARAKSAKDKPINNVLL